VIETQGGANYMMVLCGSCGHGEHVGECGNGRESTVGPCRCTNYKKARAERDEAQGLRHMWTKLANNKKARADAAEAEATRLRGLIEKAPHGEGCGFIGGGFAVSSVNHLRRGPCNCIKAAAKGTP